MKPVSQEWEHTDEFKEDLDKHYNYYISSGSMISAEDAKKQIQE